MADNRSNNKVQGGKHETTTTSLPGLQNVQVIVSKPSMVKENSSKVSKK